MRKGEERREGKGKGKEGRGEENRRGGGKEK